MALIALKGVSKIFGTGELKVAALRDVDLDIEPGEFVAVAGPSGSGKSTLLNIMSGLDSPTDGEVSFDGKDLRGLSHRELSHLRLHHVGFVFQAYNLLPVLTAYENAEHVLLMQGVSSAQRRLKVREILKQVGLDGLDERFPRELSGGQQQRVAIARAIVPEPKLVLADEPTANVDSKTGASLLDLMEELNRQKGVTFIFSSHDPAVMARARRVIVLRDGRIDSDTTREREGTDAAGAS